MERIFYSLGIWDEQFMAIVILGAMLLFVFVSSLLTGTGTYHAEDGTEHGYRGGFSKCITMMFVAIMVVGFIFRQ